MSGLPTNGGSKGSLEECDSRFEGLAHRDYDQQDDGGEQEQEAQETRSLEKEDLKSSNASRDKRVEEKSYMEDLQARATIKFNKITFCKEFFYHNFFPLSAPFMYYLDGGWYALTNRGFVGWNNLYLMASQWFFASNFYLLNIVSLLYITQAEYLDTLYDILLVDLLWAMRNLVVATKYAFLSKIEMEEMRTMTVPPRVHSSRTLLTAWKDPIPRSILTSELLLAAQRSKVVLKNHYFSLDSNVDSTGAIQDMVVDLRLANDDLNGSIFSFVRRADRWLEMATHEVTKDPMMLAEVGGVGNVGLLPVRLYAAHVICQACSLSRLRRLGHTLLSQHLRKCATILGITHAIIPVVGHFIFGANKIPGPQWTTYCVLIPSFILMSFAMISNVSFMMIGILDFRRRHFIAQSLDEVLRTGVYTGTQHVRSVSLNIRSTLKQKLFSCWLRFWDPHSDDSNNTRGSSSGALSGAGVFFDFSNPDSLLAWWVCRQLLSNFGYGFHKRIKYNTTYFAGYCVILFIFLLSRMATSVKKSDFNHLVSVTFNIIVFLSLLALMVWPGGDTNRMLQLHGSTLIRRKINTQMKMIKEGKLVRSEVDLKISRAAIEIISSIADAVKWDNAKNKLSICGFEASGQLISVVVAVVTATISIGIGQIVQNGVTL